MGVSHTTYENTVLLLSKDEVTNGGGGDGERVNTGNIQTVEMTDGAMNSGMQEWCSRF